MPAVESVTGPIDADQLGMTLIHEHLRFRDESVADQWPHAYEQENAYDLALDAARRAMAGGVKTIGEPTVMFGGRDVDFLRRVAEETELQVIASTGIYTYDYLPHFFANRDADAMADLFVHDIEEGIQGTGVKAGFLKCAADAPGVTESIEKVHRAVARASQRTGAPIMAHSRPASDTGPRQIEIFLEEGIDPQKIQIAHTGDTDDLDYIQRVLDTGVFIGMDRYGLEMFLPADRRNATVLALLERGHADRMFLSADSCATIDWFPHEAEEQFYDGGLIDREWHIGYVMEKAVPALREGGMTDDQLSTMMENNPRRWLAG